MSMEEAIEQAEIIFDDGSMPSLTTTEQVPEVVTSVAAAPAPPTPATPPTTVEPNPQPQQPPVTVTNTEQPQEHIEIEEEVVEIAVEEEVVTKEEEEEPVQAQPEEEAPVATRHHNLRPKRTLRHVQALKQQAKRRKRNANVASTTADSPNPTLHHPAATAVSPVMQKVCKKPTSTSMHNNGGETKIKE